MSLPTVEFFGTKVSRLICGGNPQNGFSHVSEDLDWEMIDYYTMPNIQKLLDECWRYGINTIQTRGGSLEMRMILEHRQDGGQMQWIAQTASNWRKIDVNIKKCAQFGAMAVYHHGTAVDNQWHEGKIDEVRDLVNAIHDQGLPAGIGTHIPEVIEYMEEKEWGVDFYMACFYNLARGYKPAPAEDQDAYAKDHFPSEDPHRMCATIRSVDKPCIGFKILAASRKCETPETIREAFKFAFDNIKPGDMVDVGMFQKYKNQVEENTAIVRKILVGGEASKHA